MQSLSEIRIAGFGGQGVILAAAIIGKAAALYQGGYATMTQSFGPEAREYASVELTRSRYRQLERLRDRAARVRGRGRQAV